MLKPNSYIKIISKKDIIGLKIIDFVRIKYFLL